MPDDRQPPGALSGGLLLSEIVPIRTALTPFERNLPPPPPFGHSPLHSKDSV